MWLTERFASLGSYQPWERRRLLDLACLRNTLVAGAVLGLASTRLSQGWPTWLIVGLAPCDAILTAMVSADIVEHIAKRWIFGYVYNPNVFAMGELEGSMTPMHPSLERLWRHAMYKVMAPWHCDPPWGQWENPPRRIG